MTRMSLKQGMARLAGKAAAMGLVGGIAFGTAAMADEGVVGMPRPGQLGLQAPATDLMSQLEWLHNDILLPIITVITLFVLALLIAVMVKFNAKANPVPSRTTHNTLIEVAWTLIPVLILVGIAVPSNACAGPVCAEPRFTYRYFPACTCAHSARPSGTGPRSRSAGT